MTVYGVIVMWSDLFEDEVHVFDNPQDRDRYYRQRVRKETGMPDAAWDEVAERYDEMMRCEHKFHQLYCFDSEILSRDRGIADQ